MTARPAILDSLILHDYIEATEQRYRLPQLEEAIEKAIEDENTGFLSQIPIYFPRNLMLYEALKLAAKKGKLEAYKTLLGQKSTDFWRKGVSAATSRIDLDRNYVREAVINERCDIVDYALNEVGVFLRAHTKCALSITDTAKIPFIRYQESNFHCAKANASLRELLLPYLPERIREEFNCASSAIRYLRPTDSRYGFNCDADWTLTKAQSSLN